MTQTFDQRMRKAAARAAESREEIEDACRLLRRAADISQEDTSEAVDQAARALFVLTTSIDHDDDRSRLLWLVLLSTYHDGSALPADDPHWTAASGALTPDWRATELDPAITGFLVALDGTYYSTVPDSPTVAQWRALRGKAKGIVKALDAWADGDDTEQAR